MSTSLQDRLGVALGLALTAATATWWLGSTRLALAQGQDTAGAAALAIEALWLARAMALPPLALRLGVLRGSRPAAANCAAFVAAPWPLLLLAWSASGLPTGRVVAAEVALLAGGLVVPLIGQGLRGVLRSTQLAATAGTAIGTILAAGLWLTRALWWSPPP